ncbi:hypothetical protein [Novosphingobium guangzhouense]|nr:hypothetical protein [Novosphingobium guangzhouense]
MADIVTQFDEAGADPVKGMFENAETLRSGLKLPTYLTEAYQRGEDLTLAKLAYREEDMPNSFNELLPRVTAAMAFADQWERTRPA